jgi:hypothetical protein
VGWFNSIVSQGIDAAIVNFFSSKQLRSSLLYSKSDSVADSLLGGRVLNDPILAPVWNASALQAQLTPPAFVSPQQNASIGVLGTIPTRYWLNFTYLPTGVLPIAYQPVPLFRASSGGLDGIDDQISAAISTTLEELSKVDKSILLKNNAKPAELAIFYSLLDKYVQGLPHGGVYFDKIDHSAKSYDWTFATGFDKRFSASTTFPPMGIRQLYQQVSLDNAVLRTGNVAGLGAATITQGFRAMPQVQTNKIDIPFDGLIGGILYPQGISFLLPVCILTDFKEIY